MTTATNLNAKRRRSPASIATGIVVVLGLALVGASGLYTDSLWFGQLGYQEVFTTQILAQAGVFTAAALFFGLITWLGFFIAYKNRPIYLKFADEGDPFAQYRALLDQLRKVVSVGLPILLGIFAGVAAASRWPIVMMWLNRTYTGEVDAQFGLDVSFYMFDLPFLQALTSFVSAAVLLAGIIAAAVHIIYGNIRFRGRETKVGKSARVQLSVTAALYLLVQGASLWLDQYSTMTSSSGLYTGATYTDVNATIPGFQILALISLVVAILFLITAVMGKWRLPIMGTALMIISSMVLGALYPWIVQTFQVGPNERTIEAQYIERNIEATRAAYGLQDVVNQRRMIDESPAAEEFKQVMRGKLDALLALAEATDCRRARLLSYFGEAYAGQQDSGAGIYMPYCGNCDNCLHPPEVWDGTDAARKLLSTVYRCQQASRSGFGAAHTIDIVRGKLTEKVQQRGHDSLSTFGVGADYSEQQLRAVLRQLIAMGALNVRSEDGFNTLELTEGSRPVLRGEQSVLLRESVTVEKAPRGSRSKARSTPAVAAANLGPDAMVRFINLKAWRAEVAREHNLPAYVIFHDATLAAIAEADPQSLADLQGISGIGAKKLEAYGEQVMRACRA